MKRYLSAREAAPYMDAPDGVCRVCGKPVSGRRTRWCGKKCVEKYLAETGGSMRPHIEVRDHGVCELCGLDCEAVADALYELASQTLRGEWCEDGALRRFRLDHDLMGRSFWEADHRVPLVEGGSRLIGNLRTLCRWCHKRETAALSGRRARKEVTP